MTIAATAEIAGFLAKVDEYTGALPVSIENTANASLKLDFGVGGAILATGSGRRRTPMSGRSCESKRDDLGRSARLHFAR